KLNVIRGMDYVGSDNHPAIHDVLTNKCGTSIDTSIAKALGVKPLRLGVVPDYPQSFTPDGQLAFDGGTPQPHGADPAAVFDGLVANMPTSTSSGAPAGPSAADLRKLLCQTMPAPPPNAGMPPVPDPNLTTRRAARVLRADRGGARFRRTPDTVTKHAE